MSPLLDPGMRRRLTSVGMHVVSFVVVGTILGFPWKIMVFWGVGLAIHLGRTAPALLRDLRGGGHELTAPPAARTVPTAAHSTDPYLRDLERSVEALRGAATEAGEANDMDLGAIEAAARALHERRLRLAELVEPGVRRRLEGELQEARERAEAAPDAQGAEVYDAEARAITARLEAMDDATAIADRLRARERTILHEIDAVRLALARSGATDASSVTLGRHVDKLRGELAADAEIEARLAQARRAHRARQA